MKISEVDVAGTRIAYRRREGDGVPVVFVHGVPTDSRQWLPLVERLDRPWVALDLPGFGRSARPAPSAFDYSMHGLAATLREFIDELCIDEYAIVAQDWGGGLALLAARPSPERLNSALLASLILPLAVQ